MRLFCFILILLLCGCARTVYIPVKSVKTEYKDITRSDSIYIHDSIYVREKGDTVYLTQYRIEYRYRLIRDSIVISDSIPVPYEIIKEKGLSRFQKLRIKAGDILLSGGILFLLFWIIKKKLF